MEVSMRVCLIVAVLSAVIGAVMTPAPVEASGVVIVMRRDAPSFDEVKNSFIQQSFVEQIPGLSTQPYLITGGAGDAAVFKEISDKRPDAVFAIGHFAATKVREALPETPVIAAMVYYPELNGIVSDPRTAIVSSLGAPKEMISQVKIFRKIKSLGLLYSTSISPAAAVIAAEFKAQGVEVVDMPVGKQEEISLQLEGVKGRMQALVVLPDPITQNPDAIRFIVTQSIAADVLPLSFNEAMVSSGIFFSVYYPTDAIGRKSAQVLKETLQLQRIPAARIQVPETTATALNRGTLQALKLKIPSNMKIGVIYE